MDNFIALVEESDFKRARLSHSKMVRLSTVDNGLNAKRLFILPREGSIQRGDVIIDTRIGLAGMEADVFAGG